MSNLTQLASWAALKDHQKIISHQRMQDWFQRDNARFDRFSLQLEGILLDYSKNLVTDETLKLLINLATETKLSEKIQQLFAGEPINFTEKRAALHPALRHKNTSSDICQTLKKMEEFVDKIHGQTWVGVTGKPLQHIVNVGIGGSHLGPLMAIHALQEYANANIKSYFISNIDGAHLNQVLKEIDPETTLFIISSKSFTTIETLTNAQTLLNWLRQKLNSQDISPHVVAVTAAVKKAMKWGIPYEQIFPLWDGVGGRYSVWSAIGLPLALKIGMKNFLQFLAGAHAMDEHFRTEAFDKNLPIIMGLLGIWYINFFNASSLAIAPYAHYLNYLRDYIQQADMESNGKRISQWGSTTNYATGPVIIGEQGCDGQHAYHQLLHQGTHFIPVDFILVGQSLHFNLHHDVLVASGLSQSQALMRGKSYEETLAETLLEGHAREEAEFLAQHKMIPGNRPSNLLFLTSITPYNLGMLIALYEHKIFVQGAIWGINSFDQWGVELGKKLLPDILAHLQNEGNETIDPAIAGIIKHYKKIRQSE